MGMVGLLAAGGAGAATTLALVWPFAGPFALLAAPLGASLVTLIAALVTSSWAADENEGLTPADVTDDLVATLRSVTDPGVPQASQAVATRGRTAAGG